MLGLDAADRARIVIAGIEGGEFWHNSRERPKHLTAIDVIEREVTASLARIRSTHPDIAAIVFECAGFVPVAAAIRRTAKLPVYDITHLCRLMLTPII
ncbi:hypothetical protein ACVWXO_000820 [Bradyrhizobium sp. LM2.7]